MKTRPSFPQRLRPLKVFLVFLILIVCDALPRISFAADGVDATAAENAYAAYLAAPRGKDAAMLLAKTGRALDEAKSRLYEDADRRCYLNKKKQEARPECFEAYVADLNRKFGEGAFSYRGDQVQFLYNATHFRKILQDFPGSPYEAEARLMNLRGDALVSDDPEAPIAKVEEWLQSYPKSELRPKAFLLLGRLHADAFVTLKNGGMILINGKVNNQAVAERRHKHQVEGLKAFQEAFSGSPADAAAARKESVLLQAGKDDGIFYGVSY